MACSLSDPVSGMRRLWTSALLSVPTALQAPCAPSFASALHSISGCPISDARLGALRGRALRALKLNKAGVSSLLRRSVAQPTTADPGFFQFWTCLQDARRILLGCPDMIGLWQNFMAGFTGTLPHGPFSKLLQACSMVNWHVSVPRFLVEHDGIGFLMELPCKALKLRAEAAWLRYVGLQHCHRATMNDLQGVDRALLIASQRRLNALDVARTAALQSGAFICGVEHCRLDLAQDGFCSTCQVPDVLSPGL